MKVNTNYITSSGAKIPVSISIERVNPSKVTEHQTTDKEERNKWCLNGKPCAKYGKRNCCPPKVKLFNELKERKYMYLVMVQIDLKDYYGIYPKVKESKSWAYFGMDGTHKMTRNINNRIVTELSSKGSQGFRVGGCLGCQVPKGGACKNFQPALEATGVDVIALANDVFDYEIKWRKPKKPMRMMTAVGGIYTDDNISPKRLKEVIASVCNVQ